MPDAVAREQHNHFTRVVKREGLCPRCDANRALGRTVVPKPIEHATTAAKAGDPTRGDAA